MKWKNSGLGPEALTHLFRLLSASDRWAAEERIDAFSEIVSDSIDFPSAIPHVHRVRITSAALAAQQRGDISAAAFLNDVSASVRQFLKLKPQRFVLLTSVSLVYSEELRPIRPERSAVVTFSSMRPSGFALPDGGSMVVADTTPTNCTYLKASILARDPDEGAVIAFRQIDYLRACWNLSLNTAQGYRRTISVDGYRPVNTILPGPLHTLHNPSGASALPSRWWYTLHPKALRSRSVGGNWPKIASTERYIRRQLTRLAWGDRVRRLMAMYVAALDEYDVQTSFLRLWATLEGLTGASDTPYKVLVRRGSFLSKEPREAYLLLDYLSRHRNEVVHHGSDVADAERLLYLLKEHVERLLWFMIHRGKRFPKIEDVWALLDLPRNDKDLQASLQRHNMVRALRGRA